MKVTCRRCGTVYDMPRIADVVEMETCPVCDDIKKTMDKVLDIK